jgi:hypothetical protein
MVPGEKLNRFPVQDNSSGWIFTDPAKVVLWKSYNKNPENGKMFF